MGHLTGILVPVDFSDKSAIAARNAGGLARRFHSEVTLLHVNEFLVLHSLVGPLGFTITTTEAERADHLTRHQKQLEDFGVDELSGIPIKHLVCCGDPATLIVERAHAEHSDLILMSTPGHGAFRRFLLGSVTAKVLYDAECPVWTGTHLADKPPIDLVDVRRVMCAVNFGRQDAEVIRWAADFAVEAEAKLTVVHAVLDPPPSLPERCRSCWHEEVYWGAKERLQNLLLDLRIQADVLIVSDGDIPRDRCL
jgi:nucleotide-binding universal stress UspA family protein